MSILVTGMSGVGKSAVLGELHRCGYTTCDAGELLVWDGEWLFPDVLPDTQFVAGCASNQGRFAWDAVVLLTAPVDVMLARIAARTDNSFGKTAGERAKILADTELVVPLLRRVADVELDATASLLSLADAMERILEECSSTTTG